MVWDKPEDRDLTDLDRQIIGPPRIITIPLEDRILLWEIGDMLAGLGRDMMFNGKRDGITTREAAFIVRNRIDEVNRRIRNRAEEFGIRMPRRGRRPSPSGGDHGNELNSNGVVSMKQPQNLYKRGKQ